jgi:hypothetical protein
MSVSDNLLKEYELEKKNDMKIIKYFPHSFLQSNSGNN